MSDTTIWGRLKKGIINFFSLDPIILRGVLVGIAAIAAQVLNNTVNFDSWVEKLIQLFIALSALVSALWIKPNATPNRNVLAIQTDAGAILPGEAVVEDESKLPEAIEALTTSSKEGYDA